MRGSWRPGLRPVLAMLALLAAACGNGGDDDAGARTQDTKNDVGASAANRLTIKQPTSGTSVKGNVVTLELDVSGISVAEADGDTSGRTGHFHVFVDKQSPPVGQVIPVQEGIVHTTDNTPRVFGLSVGRHELIVVMGDGRHTRLPGFEARTSVTVAGPSVDATAPARVPANQPIKVSFKAEGVEIAGPDGDRSGRKAHYHVFVDRDPTLSGEAIPLKPDDNSILHTANASIDVGPLSPGGHVLWVMLGDGAHYALAPRVLDRLSVTVTAVQ